MVRSRAFIRLVLAALLKVLLRRGECGGLQRKRLLERVLLCLATRLFVVMAACIGLDGAAGVIQEDFRRRQLRKPVRHLPLALLELLVALAQVSMTFVEPQPRRAKLRIEFGRAGVLLGFAVVELILPSAQQIGQLPALSAHRASAKPRSFATTSHD